ncbi:MAG: DUF192 domain-containing protein [Lentisphaeria bacterium]|nr:DUF192 domain-containing protein [Lentisphaeria bacterium]
MIYDLEKKCCVARFPFTAVRLKHRLRGMIGRHFEEGKLDAMVFPRCNAVHSMWMRIPLDLIFLDKANRVAGLKQDFRPWGLPVCCAKAETTIELPAGKIAALNIEMGDYIDLNADLS